MVNPIGVLTLCGANASRIIIRRLHSLSFPVNNSEPKRIKICPDKVCLVAITKQVKENRTINLSNSADYFLLTQWCFSCSGLYPTYSLRILLLSTYILFSPTCVKLLTNSTRITFEYSNPITL